MGIDFKAWGRDIKQAFDNCSLMDGKPTPNKSNPTSDKLLFEYIKPCTMYQLDGNLQPIMGSLMFPGDSENPYYGDTFTIPDYCAPNVAILNLDFSTGYQTTFIDDYCSNVTPAAVSNISPQEIIINAYLPQTQPEWLSVSQATIVTNTVTKANIANQIFSLVNSGNISYQITSNADASNNSGEKLTNNATSASQDLTNSIQAANQDQLNAEKITIVEAVTETAAGIGVAAAVDIFAPAAVGPIGLVVAAASIISDIFKEDDCFYNDAKIPTKVGGYGCCRGQCAIRGKSGQCKRNIFGYKADVFRCCLQDFYCYTNNGENLSVEDGSVLDPQILSRCYQDNSDISQKFTCDPHYRGMTQPFCKDILFGYCTGQVPFVNNQSSLLQAWVKDSDPIEVGDDPETNFKVSAPCLNFLARLLTDTNGVCTWDQFVQQVPNIIKSDVISENLLLAQNMMDSLLQNYLKVHGNPTQAINTDGYYESSSFINWYFSFCQKYPLLCQDALKNNFCINHSLDDMADNPSLANWCGCYLPTVEYSRYTQYDVNINCTPTCNRANTIPLINDITGVPEPCTQNVCIMDDIAISLINTESAGDISFTQACHSCGQNSVDSIIDATSSNLSSHTSNNYTAYTSYDLIPPSASQINDIMPKFQHLYPWDSNILTSTLIGETVYHANQNYLPAGQTLQIMRTDTGATGSANFTTAKAAPILLLASASTTRVQFITGFDGIPDILKSANGDTDVPSGTLIIITTPNCLPYAHGVYIYFQVMGKTTADISISSSQQIGNYVSQFNLGRNTNTCSCIFHDTTISLVESQLKGANFSQNCGQSQTSVNGQTVPNSINISNTSSISNKITSSITSTQGFIEEINLDKTKFTTTVMGVIVFFIVIMQYLLTKHPKQYTYIMIGMLFLMFAAIGFIYLYYSFSVNWGLEMGLMDTLKATI